MALGRDPPQHADEAQEDGRVLQRADREARTGVHLPSRQVNGWFTKRNVAVAVASMALAGVVEVDRRGNEDRVRQAPGFPLREWLEIPPAAVVDWASRWTVALRMLRSAETTRSATPAVRAVELRAAIAGLLGWLADAHLPRPDMTATGADAAAVHDAWIVGLATTLRDVAR